MCRRVRARTPARNSALFLLVSGLLAMVPPLAGAAPITLSYSVSLNNTFGIPYIDTTVPGQPPASGVSPEVFVPLSLLNPAFAPLLQKVDIAVSASNQDRVQLSNLAPVGRTLSYSLDDTLTMQLADPLFPPIGPVVGPTVSNSDSVSLPFSLTAFAPTVSGSSVSSTTSFTGAQAQQFVGAGTFSLGFVSSLANFAVTSAIDNTSYHENGTAFSDLMGTATVTYTLDLPATPIALTFDTKLDHSFGGIPYVDTTIPGQPPASGMLPGFLAPLSLLNPALAPLLQKVDVAVSASNQDRVQLSNLAPVSRTLSYSLDDTLTMQLADPLFPPIGPVVGFTVSNSDSVSLPFGLTAFAPTVSGSSLSSTTSFTGAQAQQFVGNGAFSLEFISSLADFAITSSIDDPSYGENGAAFSDLTGMASVTYYLAQSNNEAPAPTTLALLGLGLAGLGFSKRRKA